MKVILNVFVWNIEHANGDIIVSQKDYIQSKVEKLDIEGDSMTTDQTPSDKTSGVGKTRWLSDQTKPDIAYKQLDMSIRVDRSEENFPKLILTMVLDVKMPQDKHL